MIRKNDHPIRPGTHTCIVLIDGESRLIDGILLCFICFACHLNSGFALFMKLPANDVDDM